MAHDTASFDVLGKASHSTLTTGAYTLRYADTPADLLALQTLRYQVFNVELNDGLSQSVYSGLDADEFDRVFSHLLVEHVSTRQAVGTYRMQTGRHAALHLGYYCAREFDFAPFEAHRAEVVELGRACIHADHRSFTVLNLLWRGVADYARAQRARYLLGCSSLTSQDEALGAKAHSQLRAHWADPSLRTKPLPPFACALEIESPKAVRIPKLLSAYLALGGKICGPPAIDREFKTVDFLTLVDLKSVAMFQRRGRFGVF